MSAAVGKENLLELREKFPALFYDQSWFTRETFMRILPEDEVRGPPNLLPRNIPGKKDKLPRAVDLAHAYVLNPEHPSWAYFLWCADTDALGQRIFVGGVTEKNGRRFEIHRHLAIDSKWAVPQWR